MGRQIKINKKAIGLIDPRAVSNEEGLIKKQRGTDITTFFGTEQASAVAYFVSDMIAKGMNDNQIADVVKAKYNLDWKLTQVRRVKDMLHKLWRAETAYEMQDQIAREINAIQVQQKELWASWELSKKNKKKTTREGKSTSPSDEQTYDMVETILEEDDKAGDPKIMALINDLGKERRKLLGLYAPEKKVASAGGNAIQLNIVGAGAGAEAASVMSAILNQGQVSQVEEAENTSIEDARAEIVEAEAHPVEAPVHERVDMNRIMQEILGEDE